MRVAAWAAILATVELAAPDARRHPGADAPEAAAIAYLAVITTALAFVLWFGAVQPLGAAKAGLLVGFMPIAAVTVDAALNGRTPSTADLAGTALVAAGIAFGAIPRAGSAPSALRSRRALVRLPIRCPDPQRGPANVGQRSDDARACRREAHVVIRRAERFL